MRCEVGLIIEWNKCDTGGIAVESMNDVMEYVQAIVEGNAQFDHVDLRVVNLAVKELDDDEDNEEERNER